MDVIVTEIFSQDLIGEGVLPSLIDALGRLGDIGVKVIPAKASIRVALAELCGGTPPSIGTVGGFDLSLFNRHTPTGHKVNVGSKRLELRSDPHDLFLFDFADSNLSAHQKACARLASTGGHVAGVVQWICLQLDELEAYENRPYVGTLSHWPAVYHPLPAGISTRAGDEIDVHG